MNVCIDVDLSPMGSVPLEKLLTHLISISTRALSPFLSLCAYAPRKGCVRKQGEEIHLEARKRALTRNQLGWHFNLDFQPPELSENKFLLFKPLSLFGYSNLSRIIWVYRGPEKGVSEPDHGLRKKDRKV